MAQTILLKRRTSDATAPSPSDLTTGEVAVNAYSGKLYIKKTDGTVTEVSGSGGGSSSFPSVFTAYKYTATNGQTTFSGNDANSVLLTYNIGNLQVFLNGVLLVPTTDFVASTGNTVVLQDGAATNDILTVVAYSATISDGNIAVDSFSGDGTTTAFTLASNPQNENNTSVFIDGIYQSKANYAISGTTLTFSEAPPNNTAIEVNTGTREVTQYSASTLELPNAGINVTGGNVDLASDSIKLRLGASNDLQLFHDGTNNYIQGGTGDLRIDAKSGERGIVVTPDGATTLYHDNAAKIATAAGGVTITGTATATTFVGALTGNAATATALANARTIGGTSFDGTTNIAVNLAATATALANARTIGGTSFDGTANIVPATAVSVTGAAQSAITSVGTLTGLTLSGNLTANADIAIGEGYKIRSQASSGGSHLMLRSDNLGVTSNSTSLIGLNDIIIGAKSNNSGTGNIYFGVGSENKTSGWTDTLTILESGNVGIGTTSPAKRLHIFDATQANQSVRFGNPAAAPYGEINYDSTGMEHLYIDSHGTTTGYGNIVFRTGPTPDTRMFIHANGNVGIGTDNPAKKLHVVGSGHMVTLENTSTATNDYTQQLFQSGTALNYIWGANQNSTSWGGANSLNIQSTSGALAFSRKALL